MVAWRPSGRRPVAPQLGDGGSEAGDFDREPVPAAGPGHRAVRHDLAAAGDASRDAEYEAHVAAGEHGEHVVGMHLDAQPPP